CRHSPPLSFSFLSSLPHHDLHSFPTRRSSDLVELGGEFSILAGGIHRYRSDGLGFQAVVSDGDFARILGFQRVAPDRRVRRRPLDRKSTRLNSSHVEISYAVFCLKKKKSSDDT